MKKMRKDLLKQDSDLIMYGCSAHWLHLLGMVQKYFRNHHKPQAWLSEKGGKKPVLPSHTRWYSEINMVESFLANRYCYQQIIQEHEKHFSFNSLVVAKVMDYSLCKDLVDQLRWPIASALGRCMVFLAGPPLGTWTPPWESCQQSISRCHHARAPHSLEDAPKVQRGEANNIATARCEHMALASSQASSAIPWQLLLCRSDQHLPTHLVAMSCSLYC